MPTFRRWPLGKAGDILLDPGHPATGGVAQGRQIFMTSGIMQSEARASMACCISSTPHQFSPHGTGVLASRETSA